MITKDHTTELKRLLKVAVNTVQIRGYQDEKTTEILETIESEYIGYILSNKLPYEVRFYINLEDLLSNEIRLEDIIEF